MTDTFIVPIQFGSILQPERPAQTGDSQNGIFSSLFQEMIDQVKQTEQEAVEKEYLLATGQLDQPHKLTAAISEAQLAVELLSQVRTKTLEAYNELMRINY